jgi:hypothetical protein
VPGCTSGLRYVSQTFSDIAMCWENPVTTPTKPQNEIAAKGTPFCSVGLPGPETAVFRCFKSALRAHTKAP